MVNVFTLVTADDPERMRACTLFTETLRIGFPTARVTVVDNNSELDWFSRLDGVNVELIKLKKRMHHMRWVETVLGNTLGPTAIIDPDVIFWKDCEWFGETINVWGGMFVPAHFNEWSQCPTVARIHTSFMWIQSPVKFWKQIREAYPLSRGNFGEYTPFSPFMPSITFVNGCPVYHDGAANLFNAIGGEPFGPDHLACYDHVNSSSFYSEMCKRVANREGYESLHKLAAECPEKLKGLHMEIQNYYEQQQQKLIDSAGLSPNKVS